MLNLFNTKVNICSLWYLQCFILSVTKFYTKLIFAFYQKTFKLIFLSGEFLLKTLSIVTCALVLAAPLSFAKTTDEDIYILINKQLAYMEKMALYKEKNRLCIENPSLERYIQEGMKTYADKVGLDDETLHKYYLEQFVAGKSMQYRARADYLDRTDGKKVTDLYTVIRPELENLSEQFTQAMVDFLKEGNEIDEDSYEFFSDILDNPYLAEVEKERMFTALRKITLKD